MYILVLNLQNAVENQLLFFLRLHIFFSHSKAKYLHFSLNHRPVELFLVLAFIHYTHTLTLTWSVLARIAVCESFIVNFHVLEMSCQAQGKFITYDQFGRALE